MVIDLVLKWSEMAWWYKHPDSFDSCGTYLGNAGNPSWNKDGQVSAMLIGNEVLVQSPGHYEPTRRNVKISPEAVLSGFGEEIDGKRLKDVMKEGIHYMYNLKEIC